MAMNRSASIQDRNNDLAHNGRRLAPAAALLLAALCPAGARANATDGWTAQSGALNTGDLVVGGADSNGSTYYLCRANYQGGVHPGKTKAGWQSCLFPYGGGEQSASSYEALEPVWDSPVVSGVPANATAFGHEADGTPLYVCAGFFQNHWLPGKTRADWSTCSVGFGGVEQELSSYVILAKTFPVVASDFNQVGNQFRGDAVIGGTRSGVGNVYICAANYANGIHPGMVGAGLNGCHFGWGGSEQVVQSGYSVLIPQYTSGPAAPVYQMGSEADGTPIYGCHAEYPPGSGNIHPGKWQHNFGGCHVSYGGTEQEVTSFALLAPPTRSQTVSLNDTGVLCPYGNPLHGDRDFNGGPTIAVQASLQISPDKRSLQAAIHFDAAEQGGDHSEIAYDFLVNVWTAPSPNTRILSIDSTDTSSSVSAVGPNAGSEFPGGCHDGAIITNPSVTGAGLIRGIFLIGDTGGDDISSDSNCSCDTQIQNLQFNQVTITTYDM
jgi:hypothetical protein